MHYNIIDNINVRGGSFLTIKTDKISVEQICAIIDEMYHCMDDYLYVYDIINDFYYISPNAAERFDMPSNNFNNVLEAHHRFVFPDDMPVLQKDFDKIVSGECKSHNLQYRWMSKDHKPIWINCRGTVSYEGDRPAFMVGCINEIGKTQKADNISGLLGLASLQQFLETYKDALPKGFVIRLGLDDFKEINEKLGSDYGDMLLRETAKYIGDCLLENQKLYRAVSDEFIIIDFDGNSTEQAVEEYKSIRHAIDSFVEANHYEAVFTISGGILEAEDCIANNFTDIMKFSEFALNEAKRRGKNCCYIFTHKDYDKFLRKRHLTQLLRRSVTRDFEGFEAYLQPLFATSSNELYGAEALMRFRTDEYGMVSPAEFIPVLEETGLIMPVGKWMLHKSLELCNTIHKYIPNFRISINISYIQVLKSSIISDILSAVDEHSISPSTVIIELTESGLVTADSRIDKLWSRMKEEGIRLALDDFGTGYSNFNYLKDLKPDIIKIDRSFTMKAIENPYEFNLLSLIANMAHNMELKVCIEGIENLEELDKIKNISPDYCQGYYFGRPCPFNEFMETYIQPKQNKII